MTPLPPVMDHVEQRPIEALTVRIAPFRTAGERALCIPLPEAGFEIAYRVERGRHRQSTDGRGGVTLHVVGTDTP